MSRYLLAALLVLVHLGGGGSCRANEQQPVERDGENDGGNGTFETVLRTESRGEFRGLAKLEVAEPYGENQNWAERSKWVVKWIKGGLNGQGKQIPRVNFHAPAPQGYESLSKTYRFTANPYGREPRLTYSSEMNRVFRLWGDSGKTGEDAGFVRIQVRGRTLRGRLKAKLAAEMERDGGTNVEKMTIEGTFDGPWFVQCWQADGTGGWRLDQQKESDFCKQFKEEPWPKAGD